MWSPFWGLIIGHFRQCKFWEHECVYAFVLSLVMLKIKTFKVHLVSSTFLSFLGTCLQCSGEPRGGFYGTHGTPLRGNFEVLTT